MIIHNANFLEYAHFKVLPDNLFLISRVLTYHYIELTTNTKLTILTLSMFALKFSSDARTIKDSVFHGLNEQRNLNH